MLDYSFDWSVLWRHPYGAMLIDGVFTTLKLSVAAWFLALSLGILVGTLRVQPIRWLRIAGSVYVQIFRNTPLLLHLFFWYFAAPLLLPKTLQQELYDKVPNFAFWASVLGLGAYTASRVGEQVHSGFRAVPKGQFWAAYAGGLTPIQAYRHVVLPYALRIVVPSLTTEFLTCFKNSALAMTIGVMEITHTAYYIDSFTWRGLETTTAASLAYLSICGLIIAIMTLVEKRARIPGLSGRRR